MNLEARLALVKQVGEEIVTEEELHSLLEAKAQPIAYDGFEPSGTAHIAQGVMRAINVNKMTRAGCRFKMFVADWHAWANNKMGGDLERIQVTGKYLIEIWRATGMDLDKVDFVWASEFIEDEAYWKKVMNIAREASLDRILRTTQIMGRSEKDKLSASQILYPCMQAADIFHLKADLTQLGMDQRKVNMLAREVGPKLGFWKPVVVSHHMLMGLGQPPPVPRTRKELEEQRISEIRQTVGSFKSWRGGALLAELNQLVESPDYANDPWSPDVSRQQADRYFDDLRWIVAMDTKLAAAAHANEASAVLSEGVQRYGRIIEIHGRGYAEGGGRQDSEGHFDEAPKSVVDNALANERAFVAYLRQAQELLQATGRDWEQVQVERATAMKMSKSNPDSAIFMTDTPEQVQAKMKKAFCPEKQAQDNPILEYYRYIIFEKFPSVKIERPAKFGGDLEFASYAELEQAFVEGKLHPADAKAGAAKHINLLLDPVREHFEKNAAARELKRQVESFKVTR